MDNKIKEYFCNGCQQLRLTLDTYEPQECRNCGSVDIIVGNAGTLNKEELKK